MATAGGATGTSGWARRDIPPAASPGRLATKVPIMPKHRPLRPPGYWRERRWGVAFLAFVAVTAGYGVSVCLDPSYRPIDTWVRLLPAAVVLDALLALPLRLWRRGLRPWPFRATAAGNWLLALDALLLVAGVLFVAPAPLCIFLPLV